VMMNAGESMMMVAVSWCCASYEEDQTMAVVALQCEKPSSDCGPQEALMEARLQSTSLMPTSHKVCSSDKESELSLEVFTCSALCQERGDVREESGRSGYDSSGGGHNGRKENLETAEGWHRYRSL
jgi:hypothetical protein